jgi:hypothetical protein
MRSDVATDGSAALAPEGAPVRSGGRREIFLRVASAVVLAPLGLWAAYAGGLGLLIATAVTGAVAACEWTRMASQTEAPWAKYALYIVMAVASAIAVFLAPKSIELVALAALVGCVVSAGIAYLGKGSASSMAFGAIYTTLPFGCFVWIREATPNGQLFLMAHSGDRLDHRHSSLLCRPGLWRPAAEPEGQPQQDMDRRHRRAGLRRSRRRGRCARGGGDFFHWLCSAWRCRSSGSVATCWNPASSGSTA